MSSLSTLPKGDSAWLLRKSIQRVMQQVSVLETNIGSSTTGNSANTQIIFNDAGTLRGDPDLIFNTALNKLVATALESTTSLVVGTSATITGDLTVDTSTLKVDASNDRVGIGTATPAAKLIVRDGTNRNLLVSSDATQLGSAGIAIGSFTDNAAGYAPLSLLATAMQFGIGGTTAMTLNSTGLGVGTAPSHKVHIYGSSPELVIQDSGANNSRLYTKVTNTAVFIGATYSSSAVPINFTLNGGGSTAMQIDANSNVGIGVTPSAWAGGSPKAIDVGSYSSYAQWNNATGVVNNAYINSSSSWIYRNNAAASAYYQIGGAHTWQTAASGTAGGTATFTTAMTLDASGNLILLSSNTPATLTTNGQLTVNATSNTNLRFSYRGSDGTTRVANITLA